MPAARNVNLELARSAERKRTTDQGRLARSAIERRGALAASAGRRLRSPRLPPPASSPRSTDGIGVPVSVEGVARSASRPLEAPCPPWTARDDGIRPLGVRSRPRSVTWRRAGFGGLGGEPGPLDEGARAAFSRRPPSSPVRSGIRTSPRPRSSRSSRWSPGRSPSPTRACERARSRTSRPAFREEAVLQVAGGR